MPASLGHITSFELWEMMGFAKTDIPEIERNYLENSFTLDDGFLPCAKALRSRYKLALLSNDLSEWSKFLRNYYAIEPLIDAAFISGDLGVRKPDCKIYQIALDNLGVQPNECVFIDDYPDRVEIAGKLGMCPILFDRKEYMVMGIDSRHHNYNGLRVKSFEQLIKLLL